MSQRAPSAAFIPRAKERGRLVNAVLLHAHAPDCPQRKAPYGWMVGLGPLSFTADRVEYRDSIGRRRDPMNGGQTWLIFPCHLAACPGLVSIRLAGIEHEAARLAAEGLAALYRRSEEVPKRG